ncbi:hypothetical protein BT63DRAFT_174682 [Microthyrium microscopicum]|uniref:Mso1 N-terminal domain-containing protein n=1 Tax=Microthyrium microscopicum TaxID=703497 RepID=A0A6A6UL41_9PEZI|nr:hypothetical protein BT63DRAFT_174682 [Microthyrium microscopicum]
MQRSNSPSQPSSYHNGRLGTPNRRWGHPPPHLPPHLRAQHIHNPSYFQSTASLPDSNIDSPDQREARPAFNNPFGSPSRPALGQTRPSSEQLSNPQVARLRPGLTTRDRAQSINQSPNLDEFPEQRPTPERRASWAPSSVAMSAASYLSSFLNSTTSKYNNLKRGLINSETDGDTEDDSHISRVLRAYYTEKGRPFPEWLPPDPKAPPPPQAASYNNMAMGYGQQPGPGQGQQAAGGRWGKAGISDLWDRPASGQGQEQQGGSLRQPRFGQQQQQDQGPPAPQAARPGRFGDLYGNSGGARPQANSRMGSYQSTGRMSGQEGAPSPALSQGSGPATAKDMLKQRLWGGGRSTSPQNNTGGGGQGGGGYAPPPREASPGFGGGGGQYGAPAGGAQFQTPNYGDNRRAPAGNNDSGGQQGGGYSSRWGRGGGSEQTQGDNAPPARGYGSGPYGNSGGGGVQRQPAGRGLPSGPRPQRF